MKPNRRRALLLVVLATGATLAGGQRDQKFSASSRAAADARAGRIKEELAQLKGHAWAGEYYWGDGLGANVSLLIAPKSGFVVRWRGCLGLYGLNYGAVEATDGQLKLLFELPNRSDEFAGFDPELTLVVWGDRHYLIPPGKMLRFVNEINAGSEPRKWMWGLFLMREGDERKAARGVPAIPSEYRRFLLAAPIMARISSVGKSRLLDEPGWCRSKRRLTGVTLDAGSAKGVIAGMEFHVLSPATLFLRMKVAKVEDGSSEGELVQCVEEALPSTEWRLSTREGR